MGTDRCPHGMPECPVCHRPDRPTVWDTIEAREMHDAKVYQPSPVGHYRIGPPSHYWAMEMHSRPCWAHRVFTRILLGWRWVDA